MSSFYHVIVDDRVILCRPRGRFRIESQQVLAGDWVRLRVDADGTGYIEEVLARRNWLLRPPVANVDSALVVFSTKDPPLSLELIDRILVHCAWVGVQPSLVLNKADLSTEHEISEILRSYRHLDYPVFVTSAVLGTGIPDLLRHLAGKVSVMVGQSGVGKSRLLNALVPGAERSTGEVSHKARRGRHTTRHVELIALLDGFIVDTPGFSLLDPVQVSPWELSSLFPELKAVEQRCRFTDCLHRDEPDCAVKSAVSAGAIPESRYANYLIMLKEAEIESRRY